MQSSYNELCYLNPVLSKVQYFIFRLNVRPSTKRRCFKECVGYSYIGGRLIGPKNGGRLTSKIAGS